MHSLLIFLQDTTAVDSLMAMQEETTTFFDLLVEGGVLMIPITILFMIGMYVIVERWRALNRSHVDPDKFFGYH